MNIIKNQPQISIEELSLNNSAPVPTVEEREAALDTIKKRFAEIESLTLLLDDDGKKAVMDYIKGSAPEFMTKIMFETLRNRKNKLEQTLTKYKQCDAIGKIEREESMALNRLFAQNEYQFAYPINPESVNYDFLVVMYPSIDSSVVEYLNSFLRSNMVGSRYKETYASKLTKSPKIALDEDAILYDLVGNRYVCRDSKCYEMTIDYLINFCKENKDGSLSDFHIDSIELSSADPEILDKYFVCRSAECTTEGVNPIFQTKMADGKEYYVPKPEYEGIIKGVKNDRGRNALHMDCTTGYDDDGSGKMEYIHSESQIVPSLSAFLIDEYITHDPYKSRGVFSFFSQDFISGNKDKIISCARDYAQSYADLLGEEDFIKNFKNIKQRVDNRMALAVYIATNYIKGEIWTDDEHDAKTYTPPPLSAPKISLDDIRDKGKSLKIDLEDINAIFVRDKDKVALRSDFITTIFASVKDKELTLAKLDIDEHDLKYRIPYRAASK